VLLGIAKGEEKRVQSKPDPEVWMRTSVEKQYPLIDLDMDRMAAQEYIAETGHTVPPPSNCMVCPYQSEEEILLLSLKYPKMWDQWVKFEQDKIKRQESQQQTAQDISDLKTGTLVKYKLGDKVIIGEVKKKKSDGSYEVVPAKSHKRKLVKKTDKQWMLDEAKNVGIEISGNKTTADIAKMFAPKMEIVVDEFDTDKTITTKVVSRIKQLSITDNVRPDEIVRVVDESNVGALLGTELLPEKLDLAKTKLAKDYQNPDGTWNIDKLEKYRFSHGHCGLNFKI
jgi:hypothetical protein